MSTHDDNNAPDGLGQITINGYVPVEESERPTPRPLRLVTRKGEFRAPTQTAEGVNTPFALSPPSPGDEAHGSPPDADDSGREG